MEGCLDRGCDDGSVMRLLTVVLVAAAALLTSPGFAWADLSEEKKSVRQDAGGNATVSVRGRSGAGGATRSSGGTVTCRSYETSGTDSEALDFLPPGRLEEGRYYWATCFDAATGEHVSTRYFRYERGAPALSGRALARSAVASLAPAFPEPRTNPDIEHRQLPGIDTWLWVEPAAWGPVSATASIPGLSATVTAEPTHVIWDMGDGSPPIVCAGPGTPYDPDLRPSEQSSDCTHRYRSRGSYGASATIHWELRWAASDGDGGTLDPIARTSAFTMTVAERQAVGT